MRRPYLPLATAARLLGVSPDHLRAQLRRWAPGAIADQRLYAGALVAIVARCDRRKTREIAHLLERWAEGQPTTIEDRYASRFRGEPTTIAERYTARSIGPVYLSDLAKIGRHAAAAYRRRHGREPERVRQNGYLVAGYWGPDVDLVDQAIDAWLARAEGGDAEEKG